MNTRRTRKSPSVEIIICVYNQPHLVEACISSLLSNTRYPCWRLLLVDDSSDGFTHELLTGFAANDPRVRVQTNSSNMGFLQSANRGMRNSDSDYVLLLNSDTVVTPGWLTKLVDVAESDPTIGMVNPLSNEFANLSIRMQPGTSFVTMNEILERDHGSQDAFDIVTAVGYCLLIRRTALEEVGLFDEVFGRGYCEDTDLHMQFTTAGWRVVTASDTYIYHLSHGTFSEAVAEQRIRDNLQIFWKRWKEQYDKDFAAFQAEGRLDALRDEVELPRQQDTNHASRCHWLLHAAPLIVRHRRKLLTAMLRPRWAMAALRERLQKLPSAPASPVPPPAGEQPSAKEVLLPTRAHYERYNRADKPSVLFVLHRLDLYGGVLRIVELINQLILAGVDARLAVASKADFRREILSRAYFEPMLFNGFEDLISRAPRCDVAVSTFCTTAGCVRELANQNVAQLGVNFLQDFDAWFTTDPRLQKDILASYPLLSHRIVTSEWLQGLLQERGFASTVIPLGFNALEFYPRPKADSTLQVIAMARPQSVHRGYDVLVSALAMVHDKRPDVKIALFGCSDLAQRTDIGFPVTDLGVITDRSHLHRQYTESDIFVDTSHFQGFGLPALEAMACKLACVLTNVGGVNHYARDEENSLMVPPRSPEATAEAILRLVANEKLRKELGEQGRKTVEAMAPQDEAAAWIEFLRSECSSFARKFSVRTKRRRAA